MDNFSNEELKALITMALTGKWIINGFRAKDEIIKIYENVFSKLLNIAKENNLNEILFEDKNNNKIYPNYSLEKRVMNFINNYIELHFFDYLAVQLALRDIQNDNIDLSKCSDEEKLKIKTRYENKYINEFKKNSLNNLVINKDNK